MVQAFPVWQDWILGCWVEHYWALQTLSEQLKRGVDARDVNAHMLAQVTSLERFEIVAKSVLILRASVMYSYVPTSSAFSASLGSRERLQAPLLSSCAAEGTCGHLTRLREWLRTVLYNHGHTGRQRTQRGDKLASPKLP